jgi:hypothetical protein
MRHILSIPIKMRHGMNWQRIFSSIPTAFALVVLAGSFDIVSAQNLKGYCLDNGEAGCQDRYLPFIGNSIDFCEETCTLTNPTMIRGLNATLYDFVCRSDSPSEMAGRVMILHQTGFDGNTRTSLVSKNGTRPIVRCR